MQDWSRLAAFREAGPHWRMRLVQGQRFRGFLRLAAAILGSLVASRCFCSMSPTSMRSCGRHRRGSGVASEPDAVLTGGTSQLGRRGAWLQIVMVGDALEARATAVGEPRGVDMNDVAILRNLGEQQCLINRDMGADGNCLFLSIAMQVERADVEALSQKSEAWRNVVGEAIGEQWNGLSVQDKAKKLRQIAMQDEREWIQRVSSEDQSGERMSKADAWRTNELFKDMAEEFIEEGRGGLPKVPSWNRVKIYQTVKAEVQRRAPEQKLEFVREHMDYYMLKTGRDGNWAGSSEMVALASALQRPIEAYGNNWVSQDKVLTVRSADGTDRVLPYFSAGPAADGEGAEPISSAAGSGDLRPIRVFQTGGGGHYQMLVAKQ